MTLPQILDETGIVNAFCEFQYDVSAPYIVWIKDSNSIHADSRTANVSETVHLELYTNPEDESSESKLESVLDKYGIAYDKNTVYIGGRERVYMNIYEFEKLGEYIDGTAH